MPRRRRHARGEIPLRARDDRAGGARREGPERRRGLAVDHRRHRIARGVDRDRPGVPADGVGRFDDTAVASYVSFVVAQSGGLAVLREGSGEPSLPSMIPLRSTPSGGLPIDANGPKSPPVLASAFLVRSGHHSDSRRIVLRQAFGPCLEMPARRIGKAGGEPPRQRA